jgi:hypothetical protein
MGRSKEMPQEVADHLAAIIRPLVAEIGSTVKAGERWGISQSHVSQMQLGGGCGIAVLITLRNKLNLSLEDLCFAPSKRKQAKGSELDALRSLLREELKAASEPSPEPPKGTIPDAPRPRRR